MISLMARNFGDTEYASYIIMGYIPLMPIMQVRIRNNKE